MNLNVRFHKESWNKYTVLFLEYCTSKLLLLFESLQSGAFRTSASISNVPCLFLYYQ